MGRLSERLARRASEGFVGRERELEALLDPLRRDAPLVVQVHGMTGIGKSALLQAFASRARQLGASAVVLDCSAIEPTERGFLGELTRAIGGDEATLEAVAARLGHLSGVVVLALDGYHGFRLLDTWLRRVFIPALSENVRLVLVGRDPPLPGWLTAPEWHGLFRSLALQPLTEPEALELLRSAGLDEAAGRRVNRFARGHPLALKLAAAAADERPGLELPGAAAHEVVQELTHLFLADVEDPLTRQVLEAASVVRRVTRPLLRSLCPEAAPEDAYQRLAALPFVEVRPDGPRLHEAVREAIAATLRAADPNRYRDYRRAAWGELRREVRSAGVSELWRYTADMLYIIENPVVREAFFPSGALPLSVEPARGQDGSAIAQIASAHEGPEAAALLLRWWQRRPEAFSVVREADASVGGFSCVLDPDDLDPAERQDDPLIELWLRDVRAGRHPEGRRALFCRRWLTRTAGEQPSPGQAACWIDLKRAYMERRPELRRVYLTVVDIATYAPVATELGFRPIAGGEVTLDGRRYHSAVLDMGPASVDGWLAELVAAELGIAAGGGLLDTGARQLVLDGARVELTQLEHGVMAYLTQHEGRAVPRSELLERVWDRTYTGGSNVVDVVVRSLRRKLADRADQIETVRGVGYRFRSD